MSNSTRLRLLTQEKCLIHVDVFMRASLHQRYEALELFPVDKTLSLPHEDLVPLVVLSGDQNHRLLCHHKIVEDAGRRLHLE